MEKDEIRFRVLKLIEAKPDITQREVADALGVSVGKANYCFRALIEKGYLELSSLRRDSSKHGYHYLLTRKGIEAKAVATAYFLKRKLQEHSQLKQEIDRLSQELKIAQRQVRKS